MKKVYPAYLRLFLISVISLFALQSAQLFGQINFSQSNLDLNGTTVEGVTSMEYGPDGRLYVSEYPSGDILVMTVVKNGTNDYVVSATERLTGVSDIVNHDDDGTACSGTPTNCAQREVTGLTVAGTAANPIIYVTSSDARIGAGSGGGNGDVGLDTNSGVITRFTWNGTSWQVVDLVRGLPRSEENHATNGLQLTNIGGTNYLIVASGGITNGGSPSTNFVFTCEYALSGAVLAVDLDMLNSMSVNTDTNNRQYIYDLPTLDDPSRPNVNGITDPDTAGYNGVDVNDPWGGNDGLNQAILETNGPVSMFSPGYRNAYDLVITESGAVYVTDNGANGGWGGFPVNEGTASVNNNYDPSEPGSNSPAGDGEFINNQDHLELITTDIQNYSFGTFYAGHPNPIRANPSGAGLFTAPAPSSTTGAVWRTLIYDPDESTPGSTTDASVGLPANWASVVPGANPVEGDWRGPGLMNPDGPDDEPITIWGTNTNSIDEYTATNFGGDMQGDLIAGVNSGLLRRVELLPNGTLETLTPAFASGLGGNVLGVTCNSDTDVFPGTIWTGTITGSIIVLEPADAVNCINPGEAGYDPAADYDSDGYTNGDEIDNGTDHCSGASQPNDFDKSTGIPLVSDLNDTDDDADGILDQDDPMQLGDPQAGGSDAFTIPILNGLFNDQQGLGGIFGLGMTGLMNNGDPNPNWLDWLDEKGVGPNPDDVLGGAPGLMTSHMTSGTANGLSNDQDKGYQFGVQTSTATGEFTVSGKLQNFNGPLQLYGNTAAVGGELGLFIGDGTQSNFIKFILNTNGLIAQQEINDVPQTPVIVNLPNPQRPQNDIVLYFVIDPATGQVDLEYSKDGGARIAAGTITAQGSILTAIQQPNTDLLVGFTGTSNTAGVELEGTWDFLNVLGAIPFAANPIPDIDRLIGSPDEDIVLDNFFNDDKGIENLTYTVEGNTDPGIGASIVGNTLTLTYPGAITVSTITIRATDSDTNFVDQSFVVTVTDTPPVLFRVNSGGPAIAAIDGGMDWEEDTKANNSQYLVEAATNQAFSYGMVGYTSEVDLTTTPTSVYDTERADLSPGTPNVTYSLPVTTSGNYEVRLYIGNGWPGTSEPGERIFDVEIEGMKYPTLSEVDLSGTFGHQTGHVFTHIIPVTDGFIDIEFLHGSIENPIINAIEILDAFDNDTPIYLYDIVDQRSNSGEQLNGNLSVTALGGDGNLVYSAVGLPPGATIEPTNGQIGGTIDVGAETGSPYNVTITVDDSDGLTSDAVSINFVWEVIEATSWRINAGGEIVLATDQLSNWRFNAVQGGYTDGTYSVNTGLTLNAGIPFLIKDASIPAYIDLATFNGLFAQERYDSPTGAEMEFTLPLDNGDYVVHLYAGNSFSGASQPGQRLFDVLVEGTLVDDDLDLIVEFGHQIAGMRSYPVTMSDGTLNVQFLHNIENPMLNALEVFKVDLTNPTLTLDPIANQENEINANINIATSATGGDPAKNISYYMTGAPDGISIDVNTGVISGTISSGASTGGPLANGEHLVVVTVMKPLSAPSTQVFNWSIIDTWTDKNEDLSYTARHEMSFVQAGDKFYTMGGRENAQTVDIYDYTANSWTNLTNSAPFEFNHFQATEYEGLIWVIGALKDNNFPAEAPAEYVWAFDPANQYWIQGPQIPAARRRGSTGLIMHNDKFYVIAGNTNGHDGGYVPWLDVYDPKAGTWTPLADAPRARDHFAAVLINDKIYVSGGRTSGGTGGVFAPTIPEVDVYDLLTNTWSTLPAGQNIPTPRGGASAVNFEDKLVVIGGEVENQDVYGVTTTGALVVTEEYDPVSQTWKRLADMNHARHGSQAIVSGNGIFTLGGSPNLGGGNQKNMEFFGTDSPVGSPSVASTLEAPAEVQIADDTTENFDISVINGNEGIYIISMALSGPDAADFAIESGELANQLLGANESQTLGVSLSGTGANRSAILTIIYNDGSTLTINLANDNVPPDVTNPGPQFNNEGDNVSLQIIASDASTNLTYSATGLPPDLVIDPNTGLITGTILDGGGNAFNEVNGLVIIEAESGNLVPDWSLTATGGATGIIAGTDHLNDWNGGTIPYDIQINTPGVYRFNWRSFYSGPSPTDENDNWLRFPNNNGVWFFGFQGTPVDEASLIANVTGPQNNIVFPIGSGRESAGTIPEGASGQGYLKIFRSGGTSETYDWQALTSDNDAHDVYVYFENPGIYTMEISERSAGHAIDRVALYKVDGQNYSDAELTAAPESGMGGGNGASANSPYTVQVTVGDDAIPPGESTVEFTWVIGTGENQAPIAVASADPTSGSAPLTVSFTGNLSADDVAIVSYLWDFQDGGPTSTETDPSYTFNTPGIYDVSLTVTDGAGLTDTDIVTINVTGGNQPPVAVAEADPTSGDAPLLVNFTGSNSTDDVAIASYLWDFMDGGATSIEADPSYTFNTPGTYDVSLTVTDGGGLTDTDIVTISVTDVGNQPPVAVAEADPTSGDAPLLVNFTGSNSTDDVGIVSYAWDFDDGNTSAEADPTYTFDTTGSYVVSLTVTDDDGLTDTATVTIDVTVENMPPNAIATASPTSGTAPLTVIFNGESSFDDVAIVSYLWDFDNGSTSTDINPVYTFTADGTYNVTLTVTDGGGLSDLANVTIVVGDAANLPPVAIISATPESGEAPLEVNFTGDGSTDDFGVVSYAWDFGDGGTSTDANPTYTYAGAGMYTVTLVVTDAGGLTGTSTATITVTEVAGKTGLVLLENPTKDGVARIQILNMPDGVVADNFMIHDSVGRFVMDADAQIAFQDGEYQLDVAILGIGLYYITVELSDGDILATKMLVQN